MRRWMMAVSLVLLWTTVSRAESWHAGPQGRHRVAHLAVIAVGGSMYIVSETVLKDTLAPSDCRFCTPNGLDHSVRDAVVWQNTDRARVFSSVTGFVAVPALELTLVALSSTGADDRFGRVLDDTIPVVESGVLAGLINQAVKVSVGRRRPFVVFGDPIRAPDVDDNLTIYSGHTTHGFAITTSAGIVAHRRGSNLTPVIFASGYALTAATGYLRMAADRHYLTDVLVGAATGTAVGYVVPTLFHDNVQVVPARDGVAIAGRF
jgi:membrane-associated phospholipid phosphatase